MESLGYMLLYFLNGSLPWSHVEEMAEEEEFAAIAKTILEMKKTTSIEDLCQNQPREFTLYMKHVRSLRFMDKPNYSYLRKIFQSLFVRRGFKYDQVFDWTIKQYAAEHQLRPSSQLNA
jgi:hypothetical protein